MSKPIWVADEEETEESYYTWTENTSYELAGNNTYNLKLYDDGNGNLLKDGEIVGSIVYSTGAITFTSEFEFNTKLKVTETTSETTGDSESYEKNIVDVEFKQCTYRALAGAEISVTHFESIPTEEYTETTTVSPVYEIDMPYRDAK